MRNLTQDARVSLWNSGKESSQASGGTGTKSGMLLGTRSGLSPHPQSLVLSMNLLKSPLFANHLSWLLYTHSRGRSSHGPQVNLMALSATHRY